MVYNLPGQLTRFIGRERELAEILQLLSVARLVTVTGPGGVGKTSLALQAASKVYDRFTDGVSCISLGPIRDPTLIIPSIAQSLNLTESPDRLLFDSLKAFLHDRQMLLLLDNFEQVIPAAPLLTELLSACAGLKVLVTSREALRLRGEQEFPLAPLELFSYELVSDPPSPETLAESPSVALFVQRAQAGQPDFRLSADNAAAVAAVCLRLDGLPLAIELAAARIKILPPQAMLGRLQESPLQLLTSGARDAPARQQTLRATMQWSYDLLNPDEQRAFRRLSAFAGGFTLDAASRVGGGQRPGEVLDDITSLINKSLVRQIESNGEPRLGMLETIREFGLEQLAQANEIEAVYRAHAAYYLSLAEESEPHLTGREQKVWLNRLRREQDNLRVALRWGVEQHETEFVLRLVGALWQYWFLRGQWSEGRRWFEEVLALTTNKGADKTLQAKAMFAAANLIRRQYDFTRARALCEQSATLYREAGDREGLLAALNELCRILDYQGDAEAARAALPEILALAEGLPDLPIKAEVYAMLHTHASGGVNSEKGARYLAESERIYRALDSPAGLATVLIFQGAGADFRGDTARGRALRDEAERLAAEVEDQPLRLLLLSARVVSAWQSGDYVTARSYLEQLIGAGLKVGAGAGRPALYLGQRNLFLGILAAVLHGQGLSAWAARVYGLADKLAPISESATMGGELFDAFRKQTLSVRAEVRLQLGDEAFAKELAEGRAMRVEDLLAIPHPDSPSLWPSSLYEPLTGRELEVLILLAQDLSNPQIAERLVVSRRTVDAHLRSIYQKLGVRSRDGAIRLALEYGLLENRHAR